MAEPTPGDNPPPINTVAMLGQAYSLLGFQIVGGVVGSGHPIKPRHSAVFAQFDPGAPDGRRSTELARGAGMTPQAMGEIIDELEGLGYLQRDPDPSDRRAKLIRLTPLGREVAQAGVRAVMGVETRIDGILGADGHATLRELLGRLLASE